MSKPTISQWLEGATKERGWSYREASRRAGLAENMVSLIVNEKNDPSTETLAKLADAFHVQHEYLLYLAGKIEHNPHEELKPEVAYIVRVLSMIEDDEVLTKALEAVRAVLIAVVGPVEQDKPEGKSSAA